MLRGGALPLQSIAQTGCAAGEKCTWQHVDDSDGRVACVPAGTVALAEACTFLPPGEIAGYDDCVRGAYCRGVCKEICTVNPDSCPDSSSTCVAYPDVFAECVAATTGLCEPI